MRRFRTLRTSPSTTRADILRWTRLDLWIRTVPWLSTATFEANTSFTVEQFARDDLKILFEAASTLKKRIRSEDRGVVEIATGQVLALLFFESSTRTDMSFQAAMLRLGGKVIGASNGIQFSSVYKGEDLPDTVRAAGCYADVIALRHPRVGASYLAAQYLDFAGREDRPTVGGDQRRRWSRGTPNSGSLGPVHDSGIQGKRSTGWPSPWWGI